ncbi:MAG: hypothetical protein PHE77_02970, partial [Candidatus Pacebacteria bacterium]|nr:hypothetical protein [Candidatus Paceibacterota bacterium]
IKIVCILVIIASAVFITSKVMGVGIGSNLDMNNNLINNLRAPETDLDAVNLATLRTAIKGGGESGYLPKWVPGAVSPNLDFAKSLISDNGTVLDFHQKETDNFVLDSRTTNPSPAVVGQIWMCTDTTEGDGVSFNCQ